MNGWEDFVFLVGLLAYVLAALLMGCSIIFFLVRLAVWLGGLVL